MRPDDSLSRTLTVRDLVAALGRRLELTIRGSSESLDRPIKQRDIQKPGLILAGFREFYHSERIQFLGRSELHYLSQHASDESEICDWLCEPEVPALVVTHGLEPPAILDECARRSGIPILCTTRRTADAIGVVSHHLAVHLAPRIRVHGVLVDVHGLGLLILGESGIGKSESAVELVARGHRLVADDAVEIRLIEEQLIGTTPPLARHHIEVRGLGIVNAFDMFGITAVRDSVSLGLVVRLVRFEPGRRFDRLGTEEGRWEALGHDLPFYEIPVAPGRNVSVLLEIAARRQLLVRAGRDPAQVFVERVARRLEHAERSAADSEHVSDGQEDS